MINDERYTTSTVEKDHPLYSYFAYRIEPAKVHGRGMIRLATSTHSYRHTSFLKLHEKLVTTFGEGIDLEHSDKIVNCNDWGCLKSSMVIYINDRVYAWLLLTSKG